MEAVKELAGKAGLDVPAADPRVRDAGRAPSTLTEHGVGAEWFAEQLQGIDGAEAREYLASAASTPRRSRRFGLGLAPDGRNRLEAARCPASARTS